MKKLDMIVVGPEPGCKRCHATADIIQKFAEANKADYEVQFTKVDIMDPKVIAKYGVLRGPAVIINNMVVSEGEIPTQDLLKSAVKQIVG